MGARIAERPANKLRAYASALKIGTHADRAERQRFKAFAAVRYDAYGRVKYVAANLIAEFA